MNRLRSAVWIAGLLVGCVSTTPSLDLMAPAKGNAVAPAATGPQGGFDFAGEDRPAEAEGDDAEGERDPVRLQSRLLGLSGDALPPPGPAPAAPGAPAPVDPSAPPPAAPVGAPDLPLPTGVFGVRVVSTLTEVQPPRAVLGLPSGKEIVVQPGAMLPDERLVVLAIGRAGVQVAHILPDGYATRIEPITLPALYPVAPVGGVSGP